MIVARLNDSTKNILALIARCTSDDEEWTNVAKIFMSSVADVPSELIELEGPDKDGRGRVRLTEEGKTVVKWLV